VLNAAAIMPPGRRGKLGNVDAGRLSCCDHLRFRSCPLLHLAAGNEVVVHEQMDARVARAPPSTVMPAAREVLEKIAASGEVKVVFGKKREADQRIPDC
jgi:hypothetical protein